MKRLGIISLILCALVIMVGCDRKADDAEQTSAAGPLLAKLEKGDSIPLEDVIDKSTDALIFATDTVDADEDGDEYLTYVNVAKQRDRDAREIENGDTIDQMADALAGTLVDVFDGFADVVEDVFTGFGTGTSAGAVTDDSASTADDDSMTGTGVGDSGTGSDSTSADDSDDRYTSETDGYSIIFPDSWDQNEVELGEINMVIAVSDAEDANDSFLESVAVATEELPLEMDLEAYADLSIAGAQVLLTDFVEVERTEVTLDGVKAKKITYTHTSGATKLKVLLYVVPKELRGYTITCSAEKEQYASFEQTFLDSAASFKFE